MRFRLPSRRPGSPGAPWRFDRSRLLFYLASLAVLLLAFAVSLYAFLPISPLRERIEREVSRATGGELLIARMALLFPPGLKAENVVLRGTGLPGRESVEIATVGVHPLWSSLLGANPGIAFQARLQEGTLAGVARKDGALEVRAEQIAFAEPLAAGTGSAIAVAGLLREGTFAGAFPIKAATDSRLDLALDRLRLTGLEGLGVAGGALSLGNLSLQGTGKGNTFKIDRLETAGGDLQVTGSGSLLLNQPVQNSRINLQLNLRPGANFDANLRDLLNLFATAGADGSYRLRLTGTLASPIFAK